jgi:hypothetical protein
MNNAHLQKLIRNAYMKGTFYCGASDIQARINEADRHVAGVLKANETYESDLEHYAASLETSRKTALHIIREAITKLDTCLEFGAIGTQNFLRRKLEELYDPELDG